MDKLFVRNKQFYRLLISLALPVVFQNMITIGVNIMDTMMLGSYGEIQLSGSSLANDFINLFQFLCMGVDREPPSLPRNTMAGRIIFM